MQNTNLNDLQRNIDLAGANPTPEKIRTYFLNLLNSDRVIFDYDEMFDICAEGRETFDLLPAVCYHLSVLAQTPQHVERAFEIVKALASACLHFNLHEAGHDD